MKKIKKEITIKEEVQVGNHILEKGDKIKIIEDWMTYNMLSDEIINLVTQEGGGALAHIIVHTLLNKNNMEVEFNDFSTMMRYLFGNIK